MTTYFYTASATTGDIGTYRLDHEAGRVTHVATTRAGGNLSAIAIHPDRHRLYVADRTAPGIVTYSIDPCDGALAELASTATASQLVLQVREQPEFGCCLAQRRYRPKGLKTASGQPPPDLVKIETRPLIVTGNGMYRRSRVHRTRKFRRNTASVQESQQHDYSKKSVKPLDPGCVLPRVGMDRHIPALKDDRSSCLVGCARFHVA